MSKFGTSTYSETLKQYAYGIAQDTKSALADFIAPRVPVGAATGQFKKFDDKNAFQVYDTARAIGGRANRISFNANDGTFNCKANALEIAIDDQERAAAGDQDSALEEAKTRTVVISAGLAREKKVIDLMTAGISAAATWNSSGNDDPIVAIDAQLEAIAVETGLMPNRMVLGIAAWRKLKNHAKVLAHYSGVKSEGVSLSGFAAMLLNPQIDIRVGVLSYDTTKMGKGKNAVNIVGSEIFMFHGTDNPTQYDPGFMKTFSIGANSVEAVRTYRDEQSRSDILAVDWSEDVQLISTACAKRITVS